MWVENNLVFLRRHIVHRPQGFTLGQIPVDEEDEDNEPASVTGTHQEEAEEE